MPITKTALENAAMLGLRPDRLEVLENYIAKYISDGKRAAAVVKIQRHGVSVFEGCYGTSTKDYGVKLDTIFPVFSITKPVISALLLILQEDGLVDLTEPVRRYLPEFDGGGREKICLWHLLTHTSGLKDEEIHQANQEYVKNEFGIEDPGDDASYEEWDKFQKRVCEKMGIDPNAPESDRLSDTYYLLSLKHPAKHEPRSHMTYCGYGYQLLKYVIDMVTNEPIDSFAQRVLFNPLGMDDTYWRLPEEKWHRVIGRNEHAQGYPHINSESTFLNESGSGGLKTTANDMTRFMQMALDGGILDNKRVLSKASMRQMLMNHNAGIPSDGDVIFSSWGLGWNFRTTKKDDSGMLRSPRSFGHGGWAGSKVLADPESGITAVLFTVQNVLPYSETMPFYGPVHNILFSALV